MWIKNVKIKLENDFVIKNIQILNGHIASITSNLLESKQETIYDGKGYVLLPSFLDMHCHLRDPGFTDKEDLLTGQKSALKGGFTTVCPMANTNPIVDNEVVIKDILNRSKKMNLCEVMQIGAVTKDFKDEFVDYKEMKKHTFLFSNDGKPIVKDEIMKQALINSEKYDFLLMVHEEPEAEMIERDLFLQRKYGGNLHICHVSLEDSIKLIRKHKEKGNKVSAEVTAHHIYRSNMDYRVHPPFRKESDRNALIEGIERGDIDCLGTDHAPHTPKDKINGSPGLISFEFAFGMVQKVFQDSGLPLSKFIEITSYNPSIKLRKEPVKIEIGARANLVLVDLENDYKVSLENLETKSSNYPFKDDKLRGKVIMTIREGEVKYVDRSFI